MCFQLWQQFGEGPFLFKHANVPNHPTSLTLVAEWKQVQAAMFQHLVESLPRGVEAVIAAKGGPSQY